MHRSVDEVGRVRRRRGHRLPTSARAAPPWPPTPAAAQRLDERVATAASGARRGRPAAAGARRARSGSASTATLGGAYTPHCARIQPAKLARGLAAAVRAAGGDDLRAHRGRRRSPPGRCAAGTGTVRRRHRDPRHRGLHPRLAGERRGSLPLYSLMIATEPLPGDVWDEIGWHGRETARRRATCSSTPSAPPTTGSPSAAAARPTGWARRSTTATSRDAEVQPDRARAAPAAFPAAAGAAITHRWGGPLGVPRDWCRVGLDRATGLGWAGGYVGTGWPPPTSPVARWPTWCSAATPTCATLPWVNHRSRRGSPSRSGSSPRGRSSPSWAAPTATRYRTDRRARRTTLVAPFMQPH